MSAVQPLCTVPECSPSFCCPRLAASAADSADGFVCDLHGYRRQWGVAMDNRRDLPGYKHYTDEFGLRPAVAHEPSTAISYGY